ncbi:PREDICTED: defensin-like protein 74 [Camelina sativa]|uniref:Defensin-like protein 74 n=1 Tax=Camelina sativa TaxID=90675 RepID=A0ABM1R0A3_CAMSA|nr:PREDICTED: defensin-like protein 74 [Camelina sativa]
MKMNCKIGFMSLLVITLVIFLFLVSDKVEAQKECVGLGPGPCKQVRNCMAACIKKGYKVGQCVAWKDDDPFKCCCT